MADDEKMRIWSEVCFTDPKHTKQVEFGRKFTSIDAHYQVMRATEVFGPVGEGWMYNCNYGTDNAGTVPYVWCDMMISWGPRQEKNPEHPWHADFMNTFGPIRCTCPLLDNKGRLDKDAAKKAMTDCLTKGLSHLGFNADVFLGKFDDNAYVAMMNERFEENLPEVITEYRNRTSAATSLEQLHEINVDLKDKMASVKATHAAHVTKAAALWTQKKRELTPTEKE